MDLVQIYFNIFLKITIITLFCSYLSILPSWILIQKGKRMRIQIRSPGIEKQIWFQTQKSKSMLIQVRVHHTEF